MCGISKSANANYAVLVMVRSVATLPSKLNVLQSASSTLNATPFLSGDKTQEGERLRKCGSKLGRYTCC